MKQETSEEEKTGLFTNLFIWGIYFIIGSNVYFLALEFLEEANIFLKLFGTFLLVGLFLFAGAFFHIKPFQWGWHYFLKAIEALIRPIIKQLKIIIPKFTDFFERLGNGIMGGLYLIMGVAILFIIIIIVFAIIKWAFNYVF